MHLHDVPLGRGIALALVVVIGSWLAAPSADPAPGRVVVTDTETTILDVVEFEPGTATLRTSSLPTLDAVAATLAANLDIELVEVQSHTSGIGDSDANLALTHQRAAIVTTYLVNAGVAPSRLVAEGHGDTQPLDRAGSAKNERVSFLIVKRSSDE
jgi:OOP family OmpA-OmpF porin